jgi:flavin reductase
MLRDRFLDAMSQAAATVSVVTTDGPAGRAGVTVSALCSVSAEPPTLLVCIHHKSPVCAAVRDNGRFCVNLLGADQSPISDSFAGRLPVPGGDKFACAEWRELETGAPALEGALVALDCRVAGHQRQGSHHVFFGEVAAVALGAGGGAPLIYAQRAYRNLGTALDTLAPAA